MRILIGAGVVLALAGCGGDDGPDINGTWIAELNSSCALGLTFDTGAKIYVVQTLCRLTSGTLADQLEGGDADFSVSGQVTMTPRKSSCPGADARPTTAQYSFQGKNLGIVDDSGIVILEPNDSTGGGSAVAQFGCFDMGTFTPHPVESL